MTIWRKAAAAAALLLLAGCVRQIVIEDPVPPDQAADPVKVTFAATASGEAKMQWSDGVETHTATVDGTQKVTTVESKVDPDRHVVAMTRVPVGKGSKATCKITVNLGGDDPDGDADFTDKTRSPGKAAVCVMGGSMDADQPERSQTVTLTAGSIAGDAQYAATTPSGAAFNDHLDGGVRSQKTATVAGDINMVVVARRANDTVTCMIRSGAGTSTSDGDLIEQDSADGLGAIATCRAIVQQKAKFK